MISSIVYDIAGIGIGPFNLGLAALLEPIKGLRSIFFEKKETFDWHPGLMIDGATLQVPFYADLVTLADPTSKFSFFAFLKSKNRLIRFSISDNNFISRKLFNEYCNWVVAQLGNLYFDYQVSSIHFNTKMKCYEIRVSNLKKYQIVYARQLVIGVGSNPYVPSFAEKVKGENVFHSSSYLYHKKNILNKDSVVLVGSGQSAAEIFFDLLQYLPSDSLKKVSWLTRSKRFFPMDYSKLSLEMTSPDYIDYFYHLPEHRKRKALKNQDMLYKGINIALINRIYDKLYELSDEIGEVPVRLMANMELQNITQATDQYTLEFYQAEQQKYYQHTSATVILSTGYQRASCNFLEPVKERIQWTKEEDFDINFNYSIDVGSREIFVQNAELYTHGFNAPDLGMGPHRNAIIINTILGYEYYSTEKSVAFQDFGV
ncbi:MAG: SidA/IucD/PvdA family monooxygenase [Ginsengibacter sp.]